MRPMPTSSPKPKKPTHGGARAGAGRKPEDNAARAIWTLRVTEADEARRAASGEKATDYLRGALAARYRLDDHREAIESVLYPTETYDDFIRDAVVKEIRARNGGALAPRRKT
jgi:hypothetical protein